MAVGIIGSQCIWLRPAFFRIANVEMMELSNELTKMKLLWKKIIQPVIVIHGNRDWIAQKRNSEYAHEVLENAVWTDVCYYLKEGHFLLRKKPELVRDAIFDMLEQIKPRKEK